MVALRKATVALLWTRLLRETSKAIFQLKLFDPLPSPRLFIPLAPPSQTLRLKGLGSQEQEGIITPLQGNFNALFCALIAPPSDPYSQ